jgi:hypothetical protein
LDSILAPVDFRTQRPTAPAHPARHWAGPPTVRLIQSTPSPNGFERDILEKS